MKRSTARWTTAVAAVALLGLPSAQAQTPQTTSPTSQQPTASPHQPSTERGTETTGRTGQDRADEATHASAHDHLQKAQDALKDIQDDSLTGRVKTRVAELKRHINAIDQTAARADRADAVGYTRRGNWSRDLAAADRIVAELLGSEARKGADDRPVGTSGSVAGHTDAAAESSMDAATRAKLQEVRTHLSAFAAAMSGGPEAERSSEPAATPAPRGTMGTTTAQPEPAAQPESSARPEPSAQPEAAGQAEPARQSPTATPSPAAAESQAAQPSSQTGTASPTSGDQGNTEEVKRHLTAARNTLSELTQLPAAAQLTGEARTQVSQLISSFNELITTNVDWRGAYEKVESSVEALLSADAGAAASTPSAGATTTPAPSTETGTSTSAAGGAQAGAATAVGTSGTTAGLDPAIRAKLIEFRKHLSEFEKAAGTTSSSQAQPASQAQAGQQPQSQSPAQPQPSSGTPTQQAGAGGAQGEALTHIAAIEAILNGAGASPSDAAATGTAGTPGAPGERPAGTSGAAASAPAQLDREDVERIRMHLSELKKALNQQNIR